MGPFAYLAEGGLDAERSAAGASEGAERPSLCFASITGPFMGPFAYLAEGGLDAIPKPSLRPRHPI
jgi:hypothetical protein